MKTRIAGALTLVILSAVVLTSCSKKDEYVYESTIELLKERNDTLSIEHVNDTPVK